MTALLSPDERIDMIDMIHRKLERVYNMLNRKRNMRTHDIIRDLLLTCPDGAVIGMRDCIMAEVPDRDSSNERNAFLELLTRDSTITGTAVHEYLTFRPIITSMTRPEDIMDAIRVLHSYHQLPAMDDYADADEDTKRKITGLLTATDKLNTRYWAHMRERLRTIFSTSKSGPYDKPADPTPLELGLPLEHPDLRLAGDDLVSLVIDYPEKADDITAIILKDGITDGKLLRTIIESGTQSLREGHL